MKLLPRPNFFIVSINKEQQKKKKNQIGSLYVCTTDKDESRNMQSGTIVSIGSHAAEVFPQAKIGDTLLLHWWVESNQRNNKCYEDEENNYYFVTAIECLGRAIEAYGIWNGTEIVPNPEYIFLQVPNKGKSNMTPDEYIDAATKKTDSGLLIFDEWVETRAEKEQKMAKLNAEIQSLSKSKMNDHLKSGIKAKEEELSALSKSINRSCIEFHSIAAINPSMAEEIKECFGEEIRIGDKVGMLNQACQTTLDFNGKTYIVALSKHFHCTEKWVKDAVKSFKEKTAVETAV